MNSPISDRPIKVWYVFKTKIKTREKVCSLVENSDFLGDINYKIYIQNDNGEEVELVGFDTFESSVMQNPNWFNIIEATINHNNMIAYDDIYPCEILLIAQ